MSPADFWKKLPERSRLVVAAFAVCFSSSSQVSQAQDVPLKLPAGFEATVYADDKIASNIQCMTTDAAGRIIVSGPGYISTLIDADGDGVAETAKLFSDEPGSGAQGLSYDQQTLYCVGGAGILAFPDRDQDGVADSAPELKFRCRTGGEHFSHAIRKGPDGWWYLIVGNEANLDHQLLRSTRSAISNPEAGELVRFSPDFSRMEVLNDGYRNAYDFDFHPSGDLFTYDSDGERDISLPWYRPTRVFHSVPGMTHGWVSRSWKKPNHFLEMSPVLYEAGRGSPTGVVCYRHHQFPEEFHDCLFVLDWTYGRVIALKPKRQGASWKSRAASFAEGVGSFGFAPTDVVVGPQGALYVSVGGRGTQGSVYRITWTGDAATLNSKDTLQHSRSDLEQVLNADQPLSSWSRARWEPLAKKLGEEIFLRTSLDPTRNHSERIRALEVLTEVYAGPDVDFMKQMQREPDRELRARAVWAYGRSVQGDPDPQTLQPFLVDQSPAVVRSALEVLDNCPAESLIGFENEVASALSEQDHVVRYLAIRVATRMTDNSFRKVGDAARKTGWPQAILMARAFVDRGFVGHPYAWHDIGTAALTRETNPEVLNDAVLLIQHSLGGFGDSPVHPPVFDGYFPRQPIDQEPALLQELVTAMEQIYPTGQAQLDWEIGRLIAMLAPDSAQLLDQVQQQITADSDVVSDIHHLIILASVPASRTPEQSEKTATALLQLHEKLEQQQADIERNWEPRIREMYQSLVGYDPQLPGIIANHQQFGRPEHHLFVASMPADIQQQALSHFLEAVRAEQLELTSDLLDSLGSSDQPEVLELARGAVQDDRLQLTALTILAEKNRPEDRQYVRAGLNSNHLPLMTQSLNSMTNWAELTPDELAEVVKMMNRLARRQDAAVVWNQVMTDLQMLSDKITQLISPNAAPDAPPVEMPATLVPAVSDQERRELAVAWKDWVLKQLPQTSSIFEEQSSAYDQQGWRDRLEQVDWEAGDFERGKLVYQQKQCAQCHGGRTAVGPNLQGVAQRFSRQDLFEAIVNPHRDVSPRYRSEMITTADGKTYTGIIIYESVDGLMLRDASHKTIRIESDEIEFRKTMEMSLMPENLLKDCNDQELADLYQFLRQL